MTPQYKWEEAVSTLLEVVKFKSLLQKTKMPGAPKLQGLLMIWIGQKYELFMGNILPTLDFFVFNWFLDFLYIEKSHWAKSLIWLKPL